MIEELGGLPAHPLLVHIPVALVPLATLGVIAMALRPRWQRTFGPLVAGVAGVGFLGALLAASTGEELEEERIAAGETISGTLHDHVEMGESVRWIILVFFLLTLAWVLFTRWRAKAGEERAVATVRKPKVVAIVLSVLVVVSGVVSTVAVTQTGHSGAKSVWEQG